MLGLQIEGSIVGVTAEHDRAAFEEYEVLLDDVLNGDAIGAVSHAIGAEHAETALVVEVSLNVACAVQRDVVAGTCVHQQANGGLWCAVDFHVQVQVAAEVVVIVIIRLPLYGDLGFRIIIPFYVFLTGNDVGRGDIIDKGAAFEWRHVNVDGHAVVASVNAYMAVGIDGAVEGVIAKVFEVVGQKVFSIGVDVVGQVGQVLVVNATRQHTHASVAVVDGAVGKHNLVGYNLQRVIAHVVRAVGAGHVDVAVDDQLTCQVDGVERADEAYGTIGVTVNLVKETGRERTCEIEVGASGFDAQIDAVAFRCNVAIDVCFSFLSVVANSMYINLF